MSTSFLIVAMVVLSSITFLTAIGKPPDLNSA